MLKKHSKIVIGLFISAIFMYLALRKVDYEQMVQAFKKADYWMILPGLALLFFSHWLRSVRWRFLLNPVSRPPVSTLYSALLIGYMANTFLPAHLGEFLRAIVVGKKHEVSGSAVFGTIVMERIIDVITLFLLLAFTMIVFPFPAWVEKSGYISLFGVLGLFSILLGLKIQRQRTTQMINRITGFVPQKWREKFFITMDSFLNGITPLQRKRDYILVTVLSLIIWACYGIIFQIFFYAFDFVVNYDLPWITAWVLLVITTFAILVPSSPGYVGTYHYLCALALGLFGVPNSPALSFAFVLHGINFIPILFVGLVLFSIEGLDLKKAREKNLSAL